jgi:hypothetical protein
VSSPSPSPSSLISSPSPMCSSPSHALKYGLESKSGQYNTVMYIYLRSCMRDWRQCARLTISDRIFMPWRSTTYLEVYELQFGMYWQHIWFVPTWINKKNAIYAPIIVLPEGGNPGRRSGKCGDILGDCNITFPQGWGNFQTFKICTLPVVGELQTI